MRHFIASVAIALFLLPQLVSAHATPIETSPRSGETLSQNAQEVRIRFSERLEEGASRIVVTDAHGTVVTSAAALVSDQDPRTLFAPIATQLGATEGSYFVKWSVVSSDDGHFTKGEFAYFVGEGQMATSTPQVEVVQSSALPEASMMAVELFGNSVLWGILILFALVLRPLIAAQEPSRKLSLVRIYRTLALFGAACIVLGAGVHMYLKTSELAALSGITFAEALPLYFATVSGMATAVRAGIGLIFGVLVLLRVRAIVFAQRITKSELALLVCLLTFAYFRAKVSHATANPFFPEISVAVNMLHLVGKDLWAGLCVALSALYLYRPALALFSDALSRSLRISIVCFGLAGITAAYIVWLHLKDFSNLTSTLWGERFSLLLVSGAVAGVLLTVHVLLYRFRPKFLACGIPFMLAAELVAGACIVFFSSLMIITSPPHAPAMRTLSVHDNGLTISLSRAPHEASMARIMIDGGTSAEEPTVILDPSEESGLLIDVTERAQGVYDFPLALLSQGGAHRLEVRVPQVDAYDATALFEVDPGLFSSGKEGERRFDMFTIVMIAIGVAAAIVASVLWRLVGGLPPLPVTSSYASMFAVGLVASFILMSQFIEVGARVMRNDFKAECLNDGNAWHLMLPMRNGVPTSEEPAEGCMALSGSFHIADPLEYAFLKNPSPSRAHFGGSVEGLRAGVPETLSFSIVRDDGTKPLLAVAHERLVHVIVISKDKQEFYHVHPDDDGAPEAARRSAFSVPVTFARGGEYLVAVDYVDGLIARSSTVVIKVAGPAQESEDRIYPARGVFNGYDVALDAGLLRKGQPATLTYRVRKDGKDVVDLSPYLGAAMHVAIVREDLGTFMHTHGEVHVPGAAPLPLTHQSAHQHTPPPPSFGPMLEAHLAFPDAGVYTVFGQFMHRGRVVLTAFTVRVEE